MTHRLAVALGAGLGNVLLVGRSTIFQYPDHTMWVSFRAVAINTGSHIGIALN